MQPLISMPHAGPAQSVPPVRKDCMRPVWHGSQSMGLAGEASSGCKGHGMQRISSSRGAANATVICRHGCRSTCNRVATRSHRHSQQRRDKVVPVKINNSLLTAVVCCCACDTAEHTCCGLWQPLPLCDMSGICYSCGSPWPKMLQCMCC